MPAREPELRLYFARAARSLAVVVIILAAAGMGERVLVDSSSSMRIDSALVLVLAACSLLNMRREASGGASHSIHGRLCASVGLLIALAAWLPLTGGAGPIIERFFPSDHAGWLMATCLLLLSFAQLISSDAGRSLVWSRGAALGALILALTGVLDSMMAPNVPITGMAVWTAMGSLLLAGAIIFSQPHRGPMELVTADRPGGHMLRRMLPLAILLPAAVAVARHVGERAGTYGRYEGALAATVIFIVTLAMVFYWSARSRDRLDRRLTVVGDTLQDAFAQLEKRNAELLDLNRALEQQLGISRQLQATLSKLSAQILGAQDEERRRMARELHDSTGAILTLLSMKLFMAKERASKSGAAAEAAAFDECAKLTADCSNAIRGLSHLLHPPLLDEGGLLLGLEAYLESFALRAGITVETDFPQNLPRLSPDAEIAVFRVVQECLSNILRHSGSAVATVRVELLQGSLILQVADEGRGMNAATLESVRKGAANLGVGIGGMRERVKQLNGSLQIESGAGGTAVTVTLPLAGILLQPRIAPSAVAANLRAK